MITSMLASLYGREHFTGRVPEDPDFLLLYNTDCTAVSTGLDSRKDSE